MKHDQSHLKILQTILDAYAVVRLDCGNQPTKVNVSLESHDESVIQQLMENGDITFKKDLGYSVTQQCVPKLRELVETKQLQYNP